MWGSQFACKRLIYLAIPINLCLWGVEAWALSEKDLRKLRVFHTRSIRSILKISIYEVKDNRIHNSDILNRINLPAMDNIIAKRQLRWIGKMARMDEERLPLKMLSCWINSPRPSRRPHTTIRNSMVRSLRLMDPEISNNGNLSEWFHIAREKTEWNDLIDSLDSPDNILDLNINSEIATESWPYTGHPQPQLAWIYLREQFGLGPPTPSPFLAHCNAGHSSSYFFWYRNIVALPVFLWVLISSKISKPKFKKRIQKT